MSEILKGFGVAVIGLGIAGKVRVRDLKEKTTGLTLLGTVSRRPVDIEGVPALTLDDALSRSDIQVLLICTENAFHEEYIQKGLEHNKHILVEFPLALSVSRAKELFQLAEEKGLVLWEENIALLTELHQAVKSKLSSVGIKSINHSVSASYNGWLENFEMSGPPFISGISCLETMIDLFGHLHVNSASLKRDENSYTATAQLETENHRPITITLSRTLSKEKRRDKVVIYEFEDGEVINSSTYVSSRPPQKQGLFMQDLQAFYQAILDGRTSQDRKELTLSSLEIAEKIHSLT